MKTRHSLYWICQIVGWGGYSIAGAVSAAQQLGWRPAIVAGYAFYFLYSIALTDLLRREVHRKGWRNAPASQMWPRLLGAAGLIGLIQTFLVVAINLAFEGSTSVFSNLSQVLFLGLGTTAATTMWVLYYVLFTARRIRREQQAQLQLALREAELRALEAQVNPHFLFNGLNSIRGLVIENPARAQDMITRLANLLRHNLRHGVGHTVPLSSEVDAVTDYLALEGVRFEDRLRVRVDVAPDALSWPVPSMLLQTLVENAVKHGIAPLPAGGDLLIRATVGGQDGGQELTLVVENTGQVADADPGATQVGLANTRERLRILYGDRARLDLVSREDHRVVATVVIPVTP